MATLSMNWKGSLGRIAFVLSALVLFTSLMDLFVNRLLFRAGPEVLTHMNFAGLPEVAMVGRISFTFEQLVLYIILGSTAVVLTRERETMVRLLGLLLFAQLASAALLYFSISMNLAWSLSIILVFVTMIEVFGLIAVRALRSGERSGKYLTCERIFLLTLALGFFFPLYYRVSLLLGPINVGALPFAVGAYSAGIYMIMVTAVAALAYALTVPSRNFRLNARGFAMAALLSTIVVAPILYGLMTSFFMGQILSLVIAMSTDIVLSFETVRAIVFFWWFFLTSIVLLLLKGQRSGDRFLLQQGIGLVLILSTTFLFNYPNYLLLGTAGVLLLTYPLLKNESLPHSPMEWDSD